MTILTKVIQRKSTCHFSHTRFEHFFKFLNGRTFDILKHVSSFPRHKITQKHNFKPLWSISRHVPLSGHDDAFLLNHGRR